MSVDFDELDQTLDRFEGTLNRCGYVPFLSTVSGAVRFAYAQAETIAGLALAVFYAISYWQGLEQDDAKVNKSLLYALHGLLNTGRGIVELFPLVNLACIPYGSGIRYHSLAGKEVVYIRVVPPGG